MIQLYKPYMPENLPELSSILHSGALAYGVHGRQFERGLGDYIGNDKVVLVNSFNSAMLITLVTLGLTAGDEVIASPMACLASNQPFATLGIKVVWADIDPKTGTLDPDSVSKKIGKLTKAIFHNHHCGFPGYIDEINKIAKDNGLYVVDDAIEAFGSVYKDRIIGNTGSDATVFSFQTVRLPNTIDGGAISFKDTAHFEKARRLRDYGIDRTRFRDEFGEISSDCDIKEAGFGATLNEVNSYIGQVQLNDIGKLLDRQAQNALKWKQLLALEFPEVEIMGEDFHTPNYWVFGILTDDKRATISKIREHGYFASGVHLPNSRYSLFGKQESLPGVEDFYARFVALPCGWWY